MHDDTGFPFFLGLVLIAGTAVPQPLYVPGALTPEQRVELACDLPATCNRLASVLASQRLAHGRVFAEDSKCVQAVRSRARLEMASRLVDCIRRALAKETESDLCRAEVMVAELETFVRYFNEEYALYRDYPLAPGVKPTCFNIRAFGAKGNGITDDVPAFEKAFAAIRACGGRPTILDLPAGTYLLVGTNVPYETHVSADGLTNCVVRGASPETTRILYGRYDGNGLDFRHARNSTIRDVEVSWRETPFVQGTIESVDVATGSIILRHQAGTLTPDNPRFPRVGHPNSCMQFDVDGTPFRAPVLWYGYRSENLGEDRYRMYFAPEYGSTKTMPVRVGGTLVYPDRDNRLGALRSSDSTYFTFENVWIRNSRGGSFTPGNSPRVTAYRCRIFPRSAELWLSTNADGFFCPSGASIIDCEFTNMNDDACNSHGRGQLLFEPMDGGNGLVHTPFWQWSPPGCLLQIVNSMDGRYLGNLRMKSYTIDRSSGRPLQHSRFTTPIPAGTTSYASLGIVPYSRLEWRAVALGTKKVKKYPDQIYVPFAFGTGFVCTGNRFRNLRGVAIQVQCPSSLIESNVVENVYRGIEISGLLHYQEGPPPYNVIVRNNVIRHANVGIKTQFMTANHPPAVTSPIADVLIAGNRIEDVEQPFSLANASDVMIEANMLDGRAVCRADLQLRVCTNVVVTVDVASCARAHIDNKENKSKP